MSKIYQFYTAFAACFPSLIVGLLNVWPSYTLSIYTSQNTTELTSPMNELQSSLVGSLPSLGGMVGTVLVGSVIDRIGRKKGGIVLFFPFVLTWAAIEFSSSAIVIMCARFFAGLPVGASLVYAAIFISEVAEDSVRGALASGPVMFYCLGVLFSYLLGWFFSYHTILWVNMAASVICLLIIGTVVESPVFLLKNNREEEARAALAHYRGMSPASKIVLEELARLKQQIIPAVELVPLTDDGEKPDETEKEKLQTEDQDGDNEREKMPSWKLLFVSPSSRRAFIVVGIVASTQVLMGMVPIQVYAKKLFVIAAPNLSSHLCSVLLAIVLLCGSLVTTLITDKAGRRVLIISSSVIVGVTMACLAFLLQTNIAPPWVSALTLLLYCFSFYCGAGTVPYVLLAEVFVSEVQSIASMLLIEWVWFLNFFIVAVFPFLSNLLGTHIVFYMFATVGFINAIVSYFIVPETKGLSTLQIQEALLRRRGDNKLY